MTDTTSQTSQASPDPALSAAPTTVKRRRTPRWLLPALIVGSLGITALALLRPQGTPGTPVNVVQAKTGTLIKTVNGTGTAKAEVSRTLSFSGTGLVASVDVRVGDPVQAGEVLARLDSASLGRDLEAARASQRSAEADLSRAEATAHDSQLDLARQVQSAQAALEASQSALRTAERTLTQQQQLFAVGAASQEALNTAQTTRDDAARKVQTALSDLNYARSKGNQSGQAAMTQARAALDSARVRVQNLEKNVQDTVLRAPTNGVVSAVNITAGNPAPAAQSAVEITNPARLYLEVPFDETRAAGLRVGQPASIQFDALPSRTVSGTVDRVEPVARSSGQVASVLVRIRLPDVRDVKPGFTGAATVTTRRVTDAVTVPLETTTEDGGKTQVWTVSAEPGKQTGKASPVTISILERNAALAAVQGVKAGDLVITPSPSDLKSGQEVRYSLPTPGKTP